MAEYSYILESINKNLTKIEMDLHSIDVSLGVIARNSEQNKVKNEAKTAENDEKVEYLWNDDGTVRQVYKENDQ